ncbi:ABC-ATPase domain-containing protein [Alkalihalobacillus sp. MEB130]|nr:ABC-ATPase domain-containing protein [Alkalihalobacillus sp. MEB130]
MLQNTSYRKVCCEDLLVRKVHTALMKIKNRVAGTGKSGIVTIDIPNQKVMERTAVQIEENEVTICLSVGLPANGRRVLAKEAEKLFFQLLSDVIMNSVFVIRENELKEAVELIDQQQAIRELLKKYGYVAFIGNGSILPRGSGVSDKPLVSDAIPFRSPKEMEVSISVPH